jgi:hypothetical protein
MRVAKQDIYKKCTNQNKVMPIVRQDIDQSTTSRPPVRITPSTGGRIPTSEIISRTPAGEIVVTEKTTPTKTIMKYAPFLAGAAILFYFLRRK